MSLNPVLRRGAVSCTLLPGPHPADRALALPIEAIWQAEQQRRGAALHEGHLLAVESVQERAGQIELAVRIRPYRSYLARRIDPSLALHCSPLGVTGLTTLPDGRWLLGRRAPQVTAAPGKWETVPAGSLDPAVCLHDGIFDPLRQLLAELHEEIGLTAAQAGQPVAVGLLHDAADDVYDLLFSLRPAVADGWRPLPTAEHTAFAACHRDGARLLAATGAALQALLHLADLP